MKLNRYLYIPTIAGSLSLFYGFTLWAWFHDWNLLSLAIGVGFFILAHVPIMIFTYVMWSAIQDGHARMTPLQSVGYFFIPGFNLYWLLQCIWGYAQDANAYILRHGIAAPIIPQNVLLGYVVLWWLSFIPYVGIVTVPVCIILVIILLNSVSRFVNATQP